MGERESIILSMRYKGEELVPCWWWWSTWKLSPFMIRLRSHHCIATQESSKSFPQTYISRFEILGIFFHLNLWKNFSLLGHSSYDFIVARVIHLWVFKHFACLQLYFEVLKSMHNLSTNFHPLILSILVKYIKKWSTIFIYVQIYT